MADIRAPKSFSFGYHVEVISTYFVGKYYNDLYIRASDAFKMGTYASLTAAYSAVVSLFVRAISAPSDGFRTVVRGLCDYYGKESGYMASLGDFEERIVAKFVPDEYFASIRVQERDGLLLRMVAGTAEAIGAAILAPRMMQKIIDDHRNPDNVRHLQDVGVSFLKSFRDSLYSEFYTAHATSGKNIVSWTMYQSLREELIKALKAKADLQYKYERALLTISALQQAQMREREQEQVRDREREREREQAQMREREQEQVRDRERDREREQAQMREQEQARAAAVQTNSWRPRDQAPLSPLVLNPEHPAEAPAASVAHPPSPELVLNAPETKAEERPPSPNIVGADGELDIDVDDDEEREKAIQRALAARNLEGANI